MYIKQYSCEIIWFLWDFSLKPYLNGGPGWEADRILQTLFKLRHGDHLCIRTTPTRSDWTILWRKTWHIKTIYNVSGDVQDFQYINMYWIAEYICTVPVRSRWPLRSSWILMVSISLPTDPTIVTLPWPGSVATVWPEWCTWLNGWTLRTLCVCVCGRVCMVFFSVTPATDSAETVVKQSIHTGL